jgi:hypothetical protein
MVQAAEQPLSFKEFLAQYPENAGRYELIEGEVVDGQPTVPMKTLAASSP